MSRRRRRLLSSAFSVPAETKALLARMSVQPSAARRTLINNLIVSLKNAGIWSKMDLLYVMAAHDQQAARLCWNNAAFNLTEVSTPTWTVDRGYTGDGVAMELTTGYTSSTSAVQFARDNAHLGAFAITAGAGTATFDFGEATGINNGVRARTGINAIVRVNVNGSSTSPGAGGAVPVHVMGIRRAAGTHLTFMQGVQVQSSAAGSVALAANTWSVLKAVSLLTDRQVAIAHNGAQLSDSEALTTYQSFLTYLQGVGAA